jgi:hypothetical protein
VKTGKSKKTFSELGLTFKSTKRRKEEVRAILERLACQDEALRTIQAHILPMHSKLPGPQEAAPSISMRKGLSQ